MSPNRVRTAGAANVFQTTQWSDLDALHQVDTVLRKTVLNNLIERYWRPVYYFLLRNGNDHDTAQDLTQDFFQEIVMGRSLFMQADRTKGRLRNLLLKSLQRYVTSKHRKASAKKRLPAGGFTTLDSQKLPELPETEAHACPEQAFLYTWAADLLEHVLGDLKKECLAAHLDKYWHVFEDRVVIPILQGSEPPAVAQLCQKYRIESKTKVSNMIVTVKRRFIAVLRRHLRESVDSDEQVEEELADLFLILTKSHAI